MSRDRAKRSRGGVGAPPCFGPELAFSVLGSGSSGNCTYVETPGVRCLIDMGLSTRETARRLRSIGRRIEDVEVVCVSHEHDDHIRGLRVLTRRQPITVAATRPTLRAIADLLAPATQLLELPAEGSRQLGDVDLTTFPLPHDAVGPVGFRLGRGTAVLGHVTDTGSVDGAFRATLAGITALVAESNHDVDMVKNGPYPWSLKRRLLSPVGHLSNDALGEFLRDGPIDALHTLVLAHLSRTNNTAALAEAAATVALRQRGLRVALSVARHDRASSLIDATPPRRRSRARRVSPHQLWFDFAPAESRG